MSGSGVPNIDQILKAGDRAFEHPPSFFQPVEPGLLQQGTFIDENVGADLIACAVAIHAAHPLLDAVRLER